MEPKTSRGPNCVGPAYSPLGFNISSQYPASTQPDPFTPSGIPIIAQVRAIHYEVSSAGETSLDGADETSFQVRRLTYDEAPDGWNASIDYAFKPYASGVWWISEIDARWQPTKHPNASAFSSTLLVTNVTFPQA